MSLENSSDKRMVSPSGSSPSRLEQKTKVCTSTIDAPKASSAVHRASPVSATGMDRRTTCLPILQPKTRTCQPASNLPGSDTEPASQRACTQPASQSTLNQPVYTEPISLHLHRARGRSTGNISSDVIRITQTTRRATSGVMRRIIRRVSPLGYAKSNASGNIRDICAGLRQG
jgi:hypothetical protein